MTDLITVRQAAELLGVTYQEADRLTRQPKGRPVLPVVDRIGNTRRVNRTVVLARLAAKPSPGRPRTITPQEAPMFQPTHEIEFYGLVQLINEGVEDGSSGAYTAEEMVSTSSAAGWPSIRRMADGRWLDCSSGDPEDITHRVRPVSQPPAGGA